jgi:hypothetical protein
MFLPFCMDFGIAETGIARGSPPGTTTEVLRFGIPFAEIPGRFTLWGARLIALPSTFGCLGAIDLRPS